MSPYRELRSALSDMRLNDLAVGKDGRNRTMLSAFRARTGRNQPSNTKFIFGPRVWLRGLIKPPPGYGVAYVDWAQQEFGIAAALSGDAGMQAAYRSGDPYLAFAKQAGLFQLTPLKTPGLNQSASFTNSASWVSSTGWRRNCLALRIGQPIIVARDLLVLTAKLIGCSGAGRMRPSIRLCSPAHYTPSSVGMCTSARTQTRVAA